MIYTRNLEVEGREPALSYWAGNHQAGHFIARSGWRDDSTIVAFRCTDHYGDHNHHDQGSFLIYRQGLLAVDPPVYRKVRGPQEPTSVHNTLLLGDTGQRDCRGQNFSTVAAFEANRTGGAKLETGDILFYADRDAWTAVAGQFAQAYDSSLIESCVRQFLFVRPGTILIVDHLKASCGKDLPTVDWLLQVPNHPELTGNAVVASNGPSRLTLSPANLDMRAYPPLIEATEVSSYTVSIKYNPTDKMGENKQLLLVHHLEAGPRGKVAPMREITGSRRGADYYDVILNDHVFRFNLKAPYAVQSIGWLH